MKKISIIVIILLFPIIIFSQNLFTAGLLVGISGSQIDGDGVGGYHKAGLLGGLKLKINLSNKKSINISTLYIGKGAVNNVKHADGTVSQPYKASYHYIELPLTFEYVFFKNLSFAAGIAPAYLISAKHYYYDYEDYNEYFLSNFDASFVLQPEFKFSKKTSINVIFTRSILSVRSNDWWVNNNLSLALHYKFKKTN